MKLTKMIVPSLVLLMSTSLFAASSGSMSLTEPAQLNGTQLKAGDYKVTWEGTGPEVTVSIMKGSTVVAKAPAHVKELEKNFGSNANLLQRNAEGSVALNGLRFSGKKIALEFTEDTAAVGVKSGTSSN
jgi:hypothetical protein